MSRPITIGVLTPSLVAGYFVGVLSGVQSVARQLGFRVLAIRATPQDIRASLVAADHIDGWIGVLNVPNPASMGEIVRPGVPLVAIGAHVTALNCHAVLPDNRGGTRAAVRHLIDHGHTRIAFVGCLDIDDVRQRYEGYMAALAERGLPLDPQLVLATESYHPHHGAAAAKRLLDSGVRCSAMVTSNDPNAIEVMRAVQEVGCSIPEQIAIIGFDDISAAQHTSPPLTTIRQSFAALGSTAMDLLAARLAGKYVPADVSYVPTALIIRRSCGCTVSPDVVVSAASDISSVTWQDTLARQLLSLARHPLPLDMAVPPTELWPGIATLVQGLEATIAGDVPATSSQIERACSEAVALTENLEMLHAMPRQIERTGIQLLATAADPRLGRARLEAFVESTRVELMRADRSHGKTRVDYLEELIDINGAINQTLLGPSDQAITHLAWLEHTTARWGCLGLWSDATGSASQELAIVGNYSRSDAPATISQRYAAHAFPPLDALPISAGGAESDIVILLLIRSSARDWGILAIAGPIETRLPTGRETLNMWADMLGVALERAALLESLTKQQATLREAYERERALVDAVRELGCPVIPLMDGVLLVPLVGMIDSERAQQIMEAILRGVSDHQAQVVLLDITGVSIVDTQVANALIQTARASMLLGARVMLVGVRPEIAQSIVGLGIDLKHLSTPPSLAVALQRLRTARSHPSN